MVVWYCKWPVKGLSARLFEKPWSDKARLFVILKLRNMATRLRQTISWQPQKVENKQLWQFKVEVIGLTVHMEKTHMIINELVMLITLTSMLTLKSF